MLGNYSETRSGDILHELREILGNDFGSDELAAVDLFEEDVRMFSEIDSLLPSKGGGMKKSKTSGFGSSCSSPALSETSDDGLSPMDDFAVGSSPVSDMLMENLSSMGDDLFDSLCWNGDDDPLFPLSGPPSPADSNMSWERSPEKRKKEKTYHSCSVTSNLWNSSKKWSHLRQEEKREALSGLVNIMGELGVRERLDLNHILNITSSGGGPVVMGLNILNDDKWKQVKTYIKKLMSLKSGKDSLPPKSRSNYSNQMRTWQPSDHMYAPMRRLSPSESTTMRRLSNPESAPTKRLSNPESSPTKRLSNPESALTKRLSHPESPPTRRLSDSCRVMVSPAPPSLPGINSKAQSRLSADPSGSPASRDSVSSSSNRRPTSNVLLNPPKSHSVPSKKDFPKDKRNIIKARRKGVNRKYQPSKNSILKKDVIQKITQNANRVTKKGLRMQVDEKDVEKALSGCFDQEEIVVLGKNSYINVDEYIDILA